MTDNSVSELHFQLVLDSLRNGITIMQLVRMMRADGFEFPSASQLYTYCNSDKERRAAYTYARESFAHAIADEIVSISDTERDPQRARNMMNARQWAASKIIPKTYGDKLDLNVESKIDIGIAVTTARARLASMRNDNQLIDVTPQLSITTTDTQSVVNDDIDPYS